jgi:transcription elongation factor GreB
MSRWKPPQKRSSAYITPEGFQKLKDEYDSIWKLRAEVTNALTAAAAEGDRSENAEYIYRKKELGSIDSRIRYLQLRLLELNVVDKVNDVNRIYFGAIITLKDHTNSEQTVRIVGPDELIHNAINISIDSPLARALLGKKTNDDIHYRIKQKNMYYKVVNIFYH